MSIFSTAELDRARNTEVALRMAGERSRIRVDVGPDYYPFADVARGILAGVRGDPRFALEIARALVVALAGASDFDRERAEYESRIAALQADSLELDRLLMGAGK